MDILAVAVFITLVAGFAVRAWKAQGRLASGDRWALLTSFAIAATACVTATLLINWVEVPTVIWLIAVGLLSGGVAGTALRWPELAWHTGTHPMRRALRVGVTLVSCALIIVVAVI
jgi:hypothetical protein